MRVAQEAARQDVQAGVATVGSAYRLSGGSFGRTRRWRTTLPVAAAIARHRCSFLIEELSVRDVKGPPVVGIEEDVVRHRKTIPMYGCRRNRNRLQRGIKSFCRRP